HVLVVKVTAVADGPGANGLHFRRGADDDGGPVVRGGGDDALRDLHLGDSANEVPGVLADGGHVGGREGFQIGDGADLGVRAGLDDDEVLADVVEAVVEDLPGAAAGGDHGDDGADADDDAQAGQGRAPLVHQQGRQG